MRRYFFGLLRVLIRNEEAYGIYAIVFALLISVLSWIPLVIVLEMLTSEFGRSLATFCVMVVFSPTIILFYTSFALLADELSGYFIGRTVSGQEAGSLKRKIRQIVGSEKDG